MYRGGFHMANYTQNYQLHQWEPTDNFLRTDFNEDHQKIDSAIKATEENLRGELSGQVGRLDGAMATLQQTLQNEYNGGFQSVNSTLAALQQTMGQKLELVSGSFTGTTKEGTVTKQTISLGFQPKAVITGSASFNYVGNSGFDCNCVVIYPGVTCVGNATTGWANTELAITSTGFSVSGKSNYDGAVFQYLAFR